MAVELKTIQHLCELSKLNYDEAGLEKDAWARWATSST